MRRIMFIFVISLVSLALFFGEGDLVNAQQSSGDLSLINFATSSNPGNYMSADKVIVPSEMNKGRYELGLKYDQLRDYLIQDVCIDINNIPTTEDPAVCARKRDLRIGESVPYLLTDRMNGIGNMVARSFASINNMNKIWFIYEHSFGNEPNDLIHGSSRVNSSYRDYDAYRGDGYDVLESDGLYTSFVGTTDPQNTYGKFWYGANCTVGDGWILFATTTLQFSGSTIAMINPNCGPSNDLAYTTWEFQPGVDYMDGKKLDTITQVHYGGAVPAQSYGFEVMSFTKEYGATRWESWVALDYCDTHMRSFNSPEDLPYALSFCSIEGINARMQESNNCLGDVVRNVGGRTYIKTGCREHTKFVPQTVVPQHPATLQIAEKFSGGIGSNLLLRGDFAEGVLDEQDTNRQPSWFSGPWRKQGLSWYFHKYEPSKNISLRFNCVSTCYDNLLYQEIKLPANTIGKNISLSFGAILTGKVDALGKFGVRLFKVDGTHQDYFALIKFDGLSHNYDFNFILDTNNVTKISLIFQPDTLGEVYEIDEAYVVLYPNIDNTPTQNPELTSFNGINKNLYNRGEQLTITWTAEKTQANQLATIELVNFDGSIHDTQTGPIAGGSVNFSLADNLPSGSYTIRIKLPNSNGTSSVTTSPFFTIPDNTPTQNPELTSFNGINKNLYNRGEQLTITWTAEKTQANQLATIELVNFDGSIHDTQTGPIAGGSVNFSLADNLPSGSYTIRIKLPNSNGTSSVTTSPFFTIPDNTPTQNPELTSFNGINKNLYNRGEQLTITWTAKNTNKTQIAIIELVNFDGTVYATRYAPASQATALIYLEYGFPQGSYTIRINLPDNLGGYTRTTSTFFSLI